MPSNLGQLSLIGNSLTKCADERHPLASLGMVAPVSKDPAEIVASALFKRLIDQSEWTHETFAAEVEVSPGRVSQWATNRGAIPAERAVIVAQKLGTLPERISPSWRALRDQFLASQFQRLTPETIERAILVAKQALQASGVVRPNVEKDPALFAQSLRAVVAEQLATEGSDDESTRGNGQAGRAGGLARKAKDGTASAAAPGGQRKRA